MSDLCPSSIPLASLVLLLGLACTEPPVDPSTTNSTSTSGDGDGAPGTSETTGDGAPTR